MIFPTGTVARYRMNNHWAGLKIQLTKPYTHSEFGQFDGIVVSPPKNIRDDRLRVGNYVHGIRGALFTFSSGRCFLDWARKHK